MIFSELPPEIRRGTFRVESRMLGTSPPAPVQAQPRAEPEPGIGEQVQAAYQQMRGNQEALREKYAPRFLNPPEPAEGPGKGTLRFGANGLTLSFNTSVGKDGAK